MSSTQFIKKDYINISSKEWLVTNGIGGYASSSICGSNTRKYHGLLVASLNPPTSRHVLVSKIEEAVLLDDSNYKSFSSIQYPGAVHPEGYQYLNHFERTPLPLMIFQSSEFTIEKTVFMPYGHNATIVEYKNAGMTEVKLRLNPLFVHRDYHGLFREEPRFDYYYEPTKRGLKIYSHYGAKPLFWNFTKGGFEEDRCWHRDIEYMEEMKRGLDFMEDTCQIGHVICTLQPGESAFMIFTIEEEILEISPEKLKINEIQRLQGLVPSGVNNEYYQDLIKSVDQFVVFRQSTECFTILAGYHWFTDWGRDTMIALLGATIALGKKKETTSIMSTFLKYLDRGMVPNRFPDREHDEPEYNTVDGTLWLFVAVYEYYQKFQDVEFLKSVHPFLGEILLHHIQGTRYHIHATEEGLLWAGDATTQLTWMDVKIGDHVVTPRYGCAVEINALWYNALKIYEFICQQANQGEDVEVKSLIQKIESNFEASFWNPNGYLNDVYFGNGQIDDSIRPNQIYALALPFSLIHDKEKQRMVCDTVKKHLFTPLGLRSLSPEHPSFRPFYEGNQWSRDTAYHQGTVWPFPVGDYMMALLRATDYSDEAKNECKTIINGFSDHFYNDTGIHCIAEVFDGLEPKEGKGCIQQAWSVGAMLRVLDKAQLWE